MNENPSKSVNAAVMPVTPADLLAAQELAKTLQIPLLSADTEPQYCANFSLLLLRSAHALSLQQTGRPAPGPVTVEFGGAAMRHRRKGGHNELLGKAVGVSRKPGMRLIDATAGLGRDSFVLADLGAQVLMCERNPIIASMLQLALDAAASSDDDWLRQCTQRMKLHVGEASSLLGSRCAQMDVIYLDPMFPQRDKSASVKKEMAVFQLLLAGAAEDDDGSELLRWALAQDVARVVVKRPAKAPALAQRQPSHTIRGKAVRYDVYVLSALNEAMT